jgi:hypothetical protein
MTSPRWRLIVDEDGIGAHIAGVETGKLQIVKRTGDVMVVKEGGHRYWWANHEPWKYAPAQYRVMRIVEEEHREFRVEDLIDFPVSWTPKSGGGL